RNCVLVGGTGTGKTHLAIAIARSCIRAGKRGRFAFVGTPINEVLVRDLAGATSLPSSATACSSAAPVPARPTSR
ncbi:hypothetical protein GR255_28330, partial [Mycobacterium tuberculosis]|nr:hypothetical protein [Mycobacterium tuberculosis]